jgi:hypothetical protein
MTVGELEQLLATIEDKSMGVWIADSYGEGGERLEALRIEGAFEAALDGDSIGDEYVYLEEGRTPPEGYSRVPKKYSSGDVIYQKLVLVLYDSNENHSWEYENLK